MAVGRPFGQSDSAYQMMAPMAAELAGAVPVPWRWEDFAESKLAFLDHI